VSGIEENRSSSWRTTYSQRNEYVKSEEDNVPSFAVLAFVNDESDEVLDFTSSASSFGFLVSRYDSPKPIRADSYSRRAVSFCPGFFASMSL